MIVRRKSFLFFTMAVLIACAGIGAGQQSKIPPEIWQKAKTKEVVRVLVTLDVPTKSTKTLNKEELLAQQKAISAAQDEVLAELAGTKHRVTGRYKNIPGIGMETGTDALTVLEHSARVVKVAEDMPLLQPLQEQSAARERIRSD